MPGLEQQKEDPTSVYTAYKDLIKVRKEHQQLFRHGKVEVLSKANVSWMQYRISYNGTSLLVCVNPGSTSLNFAIEGECIYATNGVSRVNGSTVPGYTLAIFEAN